MENMQNTTTLLRTLRKKEKMSFQDIVDSEALGTNRNKVQERLKELTKAGLIKELNRTSRKQGQKSWRTLTLKGLRRLFEIEAKNLKESTRTFKELVEFMSRPESLDDLKKAHYETDRIFRAKLSSFDASASSFEEFAALSKETASSILVSALRQIYGLYVDVTGWGKEEATLIGFARAQGGGFYLTPASKLIGGSIREGQDMSWRTVKAVFRLDQKRLREEKEKSQKQEGSS